MLGTGAGGTSSVTPVDELGVIIVSAPSRDIARVEAMVAELMRIDAMQQFIRFELRHIAAPAALTRAVGLVAGSGTAQTSPIQNQNARGNIREHQAAQQGGRLSASPPHAPARTHTHTHMGPRGEARAYTDMHGALPGTSGCGTGGGAAMGRAGRLW